jgi:hypothetical protein
VKKRHMKFIKDEFGIKTEVVDSDSEGSGIWDEVCMYFLSALLYNSSKFDSRTITFNSHITQKLNHFTHPKLCHTVTRHHSPDLIPSLLKVTVSVEVVVLLETLPRSASLTAALVVRLLVVVHLAHLFFVSFVVLPHPGWVSFTVTLLASLGEDLVGMS